MSPSIRHDPVRELSEQAVRTDADFYRDALERQILVTLELRRELEQVRAAAELSAAECERLRQDLVERDAMMGVEPW